MPWADCVFRDWADCEWQDWADCEWDKFCIVYQDRKKRTVRQLPAEPIGNFRRPYLEGNPSYVEDNQRYPDAALANARIKVRGKIRPHMTFKQPYRYEDLQKMKYRNEPAFPHHETMSAQNMIETPTGILSAPKELKCEWQWMRYLDNKRWTANTGQWFDNRWLTAGGVTGGNIVSSTADGLVNGQYGYESWAECRNASIGVSRQKSDSWETGMEVDYTGFPKTYNLVRSFFYFDLSAVSSGSVTSCVLKIYGHSPSTTGVSVQQGTQSNPLITDDLDAFTGSEFAHISSGSWNSSAYNSFTFNDAGKSYIASVLEGTALLCCREYEHDYLNSAPDDGYGAGCYYADDSSAGRRPVLVINEGGTAGGIDISVLSDSWYKGLRSRKFRMEFDNATADVSLQDKNGTEIYANATYASGDEVYFDFAGADIDRLVVSGSGDITDIEFLVRIEAGAYMASDKKLPRTKPSPTSGRMEFPDPNPIQDSERLPLRIAERTTRAANP